MATYELHQTSDQIVDRWLYQLYRRDQRWWGGVKLVKLDRLWAATTEEAEATARGILTPHVFTVDPVPPLPIAPT